MTRFKSILISINIYGLLLVFCFFLLCIFFHLFEGCPISITKTFRQYISEYLSITCWYTFFREIVMTSAGENVMPRNLEVCAQIFFVSKILSYKAETLSFWIQNITFNESVCEQGKQKAMAVCFILGLGSLVSWNSMLTIGDYYYKLFPVSYLSLLQISNGCIKLSTNLW